MPIHKINIPSIPCGIVLDSDTLMVAFNYTQKGTLMDSQKNVPLAVWKQKGLEIEGKLFLYNMFVKPEGALKEYLKAIIQHDGQLQQMPFGFNF